MLLKKCVCPRGADSLGASGRSTEQSAPCVQLQFFEFQHGS